MKKYFPDHNIKIYSGKIIKRTKDGNGINVKIKTAENITNSTK